MKEPFDQGNKEKFTQNTQGQSSPVPVTHSLWVVDRKEITVKGVTDVHSFDEGFVELDTTCGHLTLEGRGLHMIVLDTKGGVVSVTGTLTGLLYEDPALADRDADGSRKGQSGRKGRFSRLFR